MRDTDYAIDTPFLTNAPVQNNLLLHCLDQGAGGNGLYINANKTKLTCFNQERTISSLSGRSLELDKFI